MNKNISEQVKRATVAIAALNTIDSKHPFTIVGSGFCVAKEGIVITCRHVVEALMAKTVTQQIALIPSEERQKKIQKMGTVQVITPHAVFYNTTDYSDRIMVYPSPVKEMTALEDFDLAVLNLFPHKAFNSGYPYLEIEHTDEVHEGDDISTCGFPLGNFLHEQLSTVTSSFTQGIISSIIPTPNAKPPYLKGYQLNLTATYGNSDVPVFHVNSGKVIGVLQRGVCDREGKIIQGLSCAEPLYPIIDRKLSV